MMNLEASSEVFKDSSMPYISTPMGCLSFDMREMTELGKRQCIVRADSGTGGSDMQNENMKVLTGVRPYSLELPASYRSVCRPADEIHIIIAVYLTYVPFDQLLRSPYHPCS